jgi:hypothetical protein
MTRLILATLAALVLVTPKMSGCAAHARSPAATTLHSYHLVAKQRALRQGTPAWQSRTGKTRQTTFIQDM